MSDRPTLEDRMFGRYPPGNAVDDAALRAYYDGIAAQMEVDLTAFALSNVKAMLDYGVQPCPWGDCLFPDCTPAMGCLHQQVGQTLHDRQDAWRNTA